MDNNTVTVNSVISFVHLLTLEFHWIEIGGSSFIFDMHCFGNHSQMLHPCHELLIYFFDSVILALQLSVL